MEENRVIQGVELVEPEVREEVGKTFTEEELSRIIAVEREKAVDVAKADFAVKQAEAEKLSKMKDDEKHVYELKKAKEEAEKSAAELNAFKLKNEATKIATDKQLPISMLDFIDFHGITAEDVSQKIDTLSSVFKSEVQKGINEALKQKTPETHTSGMTSAVKSMPTII